MSGLTIHWTVDPVQYVVRRGDEELFKGSYDACQRWCREYHGISEHPTCRRGDLVRTPPERRHGLTQGTLISDPFNSGWRPQVHVGFVKPGHGSWTQVLFADEVEVIDESR